MAVFDDVLTTEGQRFFMRMLSGEIENIQFTKLVLGDGSTSSDLRSITTPIHKIAEVKIDSVILSAQNDVTITAVFKNTDITEGFYIREKALYASDGLNEVLVLYANAGSLAEFIEPSTSEVYEKIIRSIILFSQNDNVNITVNDSGYANLMDFENHIKNYNNPHNVTKEQVGLGNVENLSISDQTPVFVESSTLVELLSGEKLSITLGKIAKAIKDFINHIKTVATDSTLGHIKIGTGLQVKNGVTSVNPSELIDYFYPIGTTYASVNDVSPATFIGGTWERFAEGRTTVGVDPNNSNYDKAGKTGGSETNTLSVANLPAHEHVFSGTSKPTGSASTSVNVNSVDNHYHEPGALAIGSTDIQGGFGNVALDANGAINTSGVFSQWKSSNTYMGSHNTDGIDFAWLDVTHNHPVTGTTDWGGAHYHYASALTVLNMNDLTISGTTGSSGSGAAVNNLQPYITEYKWVRVA